MTLNVLWSTLYTTNLNTRTQERLLLLHVHNYYFQLHAVNLCKHYNPADFHNCVLRHGGWIWIALLFRDIMYQ